MKFFLEDHENGWFMVLLAFAILGFFCFILWAESNPNPKKGVNTDDVGGVTKIVEVETHGEKHEYLYYHQFYRGSITHLPNCKYCGKREK